MTKYEKYIKFKENIDEVRKVLISSMNSEIVEKAINYLNIELANLRFEAKEKAKKFIERDSFTDLEKLFMHDEDEKMHVDIISESILEELIETQEFVKNTIKEVLSDSDEITKSMQKHLKHLIDVENYKRRN